ncbi:Retrovirus-related Pol polyprotein from transposon RE1 [Vitis vinifera]|uniref:Retrovirus-related Pol polyprotein from transposon RE1 n=1 Tax=Vitis vinifera TaxID=29760 RepID=A0A438DEK2_VITVI|nr:Retrovirus-related Pol polyprotein from transposon RE1 [Vitis vinifera]
MKKNDLGEGLPELEVKPPTCVACQYGKQTRLPFPQNKAWRATQKLQLVHTDVGGPQRTSSLNGNKLEKKAEAGIFIGYSSISKAYRIYLPEINKVIVSRDVKFFESESWSWENDKKLEFKENLEFLKDLEFQEENVNIDDEPIKGTRSLSNIYQRCNIAIIKPTSLGYAQMFGVDFYETFAPVARLDTIRMLLALATQKGWNIHQMDVKSTFLNGYLEEEIFVEQREGFIVKGMEEKVYLLKKALYGLKQAPRAWYSGIDSHLLGLGFTKSLSEFTLYFKKVCDETLVVSLYVDDLLVTGSNMKQIDNFKKEMKDVFEMIDLGRMTFFLGMEVQQKQNEIFICQQKYAKEILKKFKMEECNPSATPMNQNEKFCKKDGAAKADERLYRTIIGCLMYLTTTKPDIMNVQEVISQSTVEAEYVVAAATVNQALWIRKLMADLFMEQKEGTQILVDNQAAISIANNLVFHGKTKHFKLKLYFLREVQNEGEIQLVYCKTESQNVDILTKSLPKARYEFLRQRLGVCSSKDKEEC